MIRLLAVCTLLSFAGVLQAQTGLLSPTTVDEPMPEAKPLPAPDELPPSPSKETIIPKQAHDDVLADDSGCDDCGCSCLFYQPCQRVPRVWGSAEYLLWWTRDMPVELPLVTSNLMADPVIGQPGTQVVIGNESIDFGKQHGGRFVLGGWLNSCRTIGVEANFFFLEEDSVIRRFTRSGASPGALGIPVFDAQLGSEAVLLLQAEGVFSVAGNVTFRSQVLGSEANAVLNGYRRRGLSVDFLGGFRYLNLEEDLELGFNSPFFPPAGPNDTYAAFDSFRTRNNFYGGQLGARVSWNRGRLFGDVTGKVALGVMDQDVLINGAFATNQLNAVPGTGPIQTFPGGVFTQPTNIGSYTRDRFSVIPEVTTKFGVRLTNRLSAFVGYTFLYVDEVARPAGQIDRTINPTQNPILNGPGATLVGPARPAHSFDSSSYWAQGINFGVAFRW